MNRHEEHGRNVDELNVDELKGVDGGDGKGRGVFVGVVKFVEMLIQPGCVVNTVRPVCEVILEKTKGCFVNLFAHY